MEELRGPPAPPAHLGLVWQKATHVILLEELHLGGFVTATLPALQLTVTRATRGRVGAKLGPSELGAHVLAPPHTAHPEASHDVPAALCTVNLPATLTPNSDPPKKKS